MMSAWHAVRTFDRMFDSDMTGTTFGAATVAVNDADVVFSCDVPGVKQEDLEVTVDRRVLTIRGTRKFEGGKGDPFVRQFRLPASLDDEKLTANLDHGVLTVRVPRMPKAQPRKIPIG